MPCTFPPGAPTRPGQNMGPALAAVIMSICVVGTYFPVSSLPNANTLLGVDYVQLHSRRIRFAQEAFCSDGADG